MRIANSATLPGHGRRWWWVWLVIAMLLMVLPMLAGGVRAAPPVLNIGSDPLTAACRAGARIAGSSLLLPASAGAATPAGSAGDLLSATLDASDWGGHVERIALPPAGVALPGAAAALWDA